MKPSGGTRLRMGPSTALRAGVASVVALSVVSTIALAQARAARVVATFTLPETPLGPFQNKRLPGSLPDDRGLRLGSIGSDLYRSRDDPAGTFWMITDRGPNPVKRTRRETRRLFPTPGFTPHILKVRAAGSAIEVVDAFPLVGASGRPVTGLPNQKGHDEPAYDASGKTKIAFNPSGLDTEGLVRLHDGSFWVSEEYGPSVARVDGTGKVLARVLPSGLALRGADYPVAFDLPAIFSERRDNRGFEALALSLDGKLLYAGLQSPLARRGAASAVASRNTRILVLDAATGHPREENVYLLDGSGRKKGEAFELSAMAALPDGRLLALERSGNVERVYRVDRSKATDILGGRWDDPSSRPRLEAVDDLSAAGVSALAKELVVDLNKLPGVPKKVEGLAVVDRHSIAVANDNDFDVGDDDVDDDASPSSEGGIPSVLMFIEVPMDLW